MTTAFQPSRTIGDMPDQDEHDRMMEASTARLRAAGKPTGDYIPTKPAKKAASTSPAPKGPLSAPAALGSAEAAEASQQPRCAQAQEDTLWRRSPSGKLHGVMPPGLTPDDF